MNNQGLILVGLLCLSASAQAQDVPAADEALRKGNTLYKKNDAAGAAKAYDEAAKLAPKDPRALHNLGNAEYKQQQYADAVAKFEGAAAVAASPIEQARAYHNLGNAHLQQQKPEEAIRAYKESLKRNPGDEDTRYNMAFAQRMLQKQQQQKQDQKKDDKKEDENKDKQQQDKDKKDEEKKDDQQKKDEQGKPDEQKEPQQQQPKPDQLSKQDAQRMLDALNHDEKRTQEKARQKMRVAVKVPIEKDW